MNGVMVEKLIQLTYVYFFGALVLLSASAFAQDVQIEARVSADKTVLGSTINFSITVHGRQDVAPPSLPPMTGLDVQYLGPATRFTMVNGQTSSSKTFNYSLLPRQEGTFQIPSIEVNILGQVYRTQPISIEVTAASNAGNTVAQSRPASLKDKMYIILKTSKQDVYLNERLPIKAFLFWTGLDVEKCENPKLDDVGFMTEDFTNQGWSQQIVNGVAYKVIEFDSAIYPMRTGTLTLGPIRIKCLGLFKVAGAGSSLGDWEDAFFGGMLDQRERKLLTLESQPVTFNVLPLPAEGKPAGFSGAVGTYDFNISVSPLEVKEGDPITLRMTIIGDGNLSALTMPSLSADDNFKLYEPQIYQKDNIKKLEQVIIPKSDQVTGVPEIRFSYFDPPLKQYRTITRGPFPIKVTKLDKEQGLQVVGMDDEPKPITPEVLGQDIVFIKTNPGELQIIGQHVYKRMSFYLIIVPAVIMWLGVFVYYKRTHRIKTDIVYARRLQAPRQAKRGLTRARHSIATGEKEEFYDAVFKTLQQYLGNKFHLSLGAVTFETVRAKLRRNNMDTKIIDDLKLTFEECDMVRYASANISQESMRAGYQRLARIIDHLERHLK